MRHAFSETHGAARMTQIRVIGIGSPHGDDRIGWDAVEALEASGILKRFPAGVVETCCCDRPGGLLMLFEGVTAAIMIDAMQSGVEVGTVQKFAASELEPEQDFLSSHGISVAEIVGLGRALGVLPATLLLYGIEVHGAVPGAALHPRVRAALSILLRAITLDVQSAMSGKVSPVNL
jgi:hydrogenase maturation protease